MKILVTGSHGFIGKNMVKFLRKQGDKVVTADLKKGQDLRDMDTCLRLTKDVDGVIHLAADNGGYFYLNKSKNSVAENNRLIDRNIVQACKKNNVHRFFFASSSCVYPIRNPENDYGKQKYLSERMIKRHLRNYSIARFQNVYGQHETIGGPKEKVIPAFCRQIVKGKVYVYGGGHQKRSWIYVRDLCKEIYAMFMWCVPHLDIGGPVRSIKEILDELIDISGKKVKVKYGRKIKDRENRFCNDLSETSLRSNGSLPI